MKKKTQFYKNLSINLRKKMLFNTNYQTMVKQLPEHVVLNSFYPFVAGDLMKK